MCCNFKKMGILVLLIKISVGMLPAIGLVPNGQQKNIVVVGAGYVGLVTGACFAQQDLYDVTVVEHNPAKVAAIHAGTLPFYEPGLDILVTQGIKSGRLHFVGTIAEALKQSPQLIFSCVGTPSLPDGSANLSYVFQVAHEIGKCLNDYCVVVTKSTVPVGTGMLIHEIIQKELDQRGMRINFDVASNPEFLQEGCAVKNFMQPDRVVVGVQSTRARGLLYDLYRAYLPSDDCFLSMSLESAELTKYAANAMLAARISFMNQLALLADKVGADIDHVKQGMSKDKRIGALFLNAGIGYGGSCFPKDVKALVCAGKQHGCAMSLAADVDRINEQQRIMFLEKIIHYYGDALADKRVGIWGLAFKPETDDLRYAPSIDVINGLLASGARVLAYDPVAMPNIRAIFGDKISYASCADDIFGVCDFLIILTEWKAFLAHTPGQFAQLNDKIVFDGRNCFDPVAMADAGITYFTVGRDCYQRSK